MIESISSVPAWRIRRVCIALYPALLRKHRIALKPCFRNMPDTWAGSTVDMQETFDARRSGSDAE
ncbi:hypothetical protein C7S13_4078 [Burkholderia cepacia]|nr:hypothetical protein [Burkholderia cepacia]